jgi:hypothetical protein
MKWPCLNLDGVLVRRLLILLAVLIVLTGVATSIAPRPAPLFQPSPTASPPPVPRAAPGTRPPDGASVHAVLSAGPDHPARRISARVGDHLSITVRDESVDSVALGDLDVEPVEPGVPAHFDLLADDAGSYPLVLVDAGRRIGTLVVR